MCEEERPERERDDPGARGYGILKKDMLLLEERIRRMREGKKSRVLCPGSAKVSR